MRRRRDVRLKYRGCRACPLFSNGEAANRWGLAVRTRIGYVHPTGSVMFKRAGFVTMSKPMTCRVVMSRDVPLRSG
jgi:uncharacterized protein (UPF0548 family)